MDESDGIMVYVMMQTDDGFDPIETGLVGFIDEDGDFLIPYQDEITAEEMARILTGTLKREAH